MLIIFCIILLVKLERRDERKGERQRIKERERREGSRTCFRFFQDGG
jgi:hypothetical protein